MRLLDPLFRWEALEDLLSDRARLQGMLDFESALARAEASAGVIPSPAAAAIASKCRAELFDMAALARATAVAGNPAIPLVSALTALVEKDDREAMRFVHLGATSQDAIDTGFVVQLRGALDLIEAELAQLADGLARITERHRATLVVARTWMQQAVPTTFGLKAAGWLDAVDRHRRRLADVRRQALALQFGGAVGSLAALGSHGTEVAAALALELKLDVPAIPWHAHRDRLAAVATTLGLGMGTLGKIARDISLYMQTEVGEVFEPAALGRGVSSTMPHKRNPVTSAAVLAAATRVPGLVSGVLSGMVQEEERGLGGWHAEWESIPEIVGLFGGALHLLTETVAGLEIDTARMRANLEATRGLIFAEAVQTALGRTIGKPEAGERVEAACVRARAEGRHLRDVLSEDEGVARHLSRAEIERLFDPRQYLGVADRMIDRVLAAHSSRAPEPAARRG
jgi:3-carboxy-cis,cis-muconate cycloisomerase